MCLTLIADQQTLFGYGLVSLIREADPELDVRPPLSSFNDLLQLCQSLQPGVVILAVDLPGYDRWRGCQVVLNAAPGAQIVLLASETQLEAVAYGFAFGARGCLLRHHGAAVAARALALVRAGGTFVPAEAVCWHQALAMGDAVGQRAAPVRQDHLTPRERDVLERLRQGLSNKEIARQIGTTDLTVKVHVRGIMRKLGVQNRTQAAMTALAAV